MGASTDSLVAFCWGANDTTQAPPGHGVDHLQSGRMSAPLYAMVTSRPAAIPLPWWLRLLSRVPLAILYALAAVAIWMMRRLLRHRVETVRTNIERSFPDLPRRERRLMESGYYRNLSQVVAEVIKMAGLNR